MGITVTGGASEKSYSTTAFQGTGATVAETGSGVLCAGATQYTCTATTGMPSGEPGNEFAKADGITFSMINENIAGTNEGVWAAPNSGTSTITIPIGIFGVTNVYTMLNDEYGVIGASPTTVQFNFSNGSNELFTLVNGKTISDVFDCITGVCPTYATTLSPDEWSANGATDLGANSTAPNVSAFDVWAGTYGQGTGAYTNTTGNVYLDAQDFYLGAGVSNLTLTNIVITDTAGANNLVSRDILSAITVQTIPEPSTIFLLLSGTGVVGLLRRRKQ